MLPNKARAMKAMQAKGTRPMSASAAYKAVGDSCGLKVKEVKGAVQAYVTLAAAQLKKEGQFKFAGALNLKLKVKPAAPARKGVNPFTKEPCVFKARPASKAVKALALKKLKSMLN
eukprot:TRINITY_DN4555_c0_g2_i8.p1 TRINITY_DN4555_c0_g2~~TRINITY_DN4555_c0_g2_i8.p1  ORF type:complete len:116 (+),score=12.69 TRINITY_DN4555_c0_g2_i8:119-466(+)